MQVIEHIEAVNNPEEILPIPDADGFIVGPRDLSDSLNMRGQFEHPEVLATLAKYQKMATARQTEGYKFLVFSLDIFFRATPAAMT